MKFNLLSIILISVCFKLHAQISPNRLTILDTVIKEISVKSIKAVKITFEPNQKGTLHKHPCNVLGYILSGSCYFKVKDDSAKILNAGDAFIEPVDVIIEHFDNYSDKGKLIFIAYYLVQNEQELIQWIDKGHKN